MQSWLWYFIFILLKSRCIMFISIYNMRLLPNCRASFSAKAPVSINEVSRCSKLLFAKPCVIFTCVRACNQTASMAYHAALFVRAGHALILTLFTSICICLSAPQGWDAMVHKLNFLGSSGPLRTLVIYHLGPLREQENSIDVMANNVKLFVGSVEPCSRASSFPDFYIFNVVGDSHPLISLVPTRQPNVGLVQWNFTDSDLATHIRTLEMLTVENTNKFDAVLFVNHGVRGPLVHRRRCDWVEDFLEPLRSNNVAIVGPTLSCEISPHVQTHMFALRTSLIPFVQAKMKEKLEVKYKSWVDLIASLELGLTGLIMSVGYNVSSLLHQSRGQPYFTKCLKYDGPKNLVDQNPTSWCGLSPETLVFVKWGGEAMRNPGYMCNTMVSQMDDALELTAQTEPHLQLAVPEVRRGGPMSNVFKMYAQEAWIDRRPVLPLSTSFLSGKSAPKVCFLVRVIAPRLSHLTYENPQTDLINKELKLLVTTLRRQSNPNWLAMIYRIDNSPIHGEIHSLIASFNDSRLEYGDFAHEGGLRYSSQDAGYTVMDKFLLRALQRPECQWISVTTSDNAYGSEVVQRVLSYQGNAPMLAVPLDSKRFFDRSQRFTQKTRKHSSEHALLRPLFELELSDTISHPVARARLPRFYRHSHSHPKIYNNNSAVTSELILQGCTMLSRLHATNFTHLVRVSPLSRRLDIAAVFFSRLKLKRENILFGNFTDRSKFPCLDTAADSTDPPGYLCLNAQGAHLLHHLTTQRSRWTLARLPADGLRSVVFHGNSPTLCIGADHIWLDHQDPLQQRCVTAMDVFRMMEKPENLAKYDFDHLWKGQGPVIGSCLRMLQGQRQYLYLL